MYGKAGVLFCMEDLNQKPTHKLILTARKELVLSGVNDVKSFDEREISLETTQGTLLIRGNELHVRKLTLERGEMEIEGRVDSYTYTDVVKHREKGESLFLRLFR